MKAPFVGRALAAATLFALFNAGFAQSPDID